MKKFLVVVPNHICPPLITPDFNPACQNLMRYSLVPAIELPLPPWQEENSSYQGNSGGVWGLLSSLRILRSEVRKLISAIEGLLCAINCSKL